MPGRDIFYHVWLVRSHWHTCARTDKPVWQTCATTDSVCVMWLTFTTVRRIQSRWVGYQYLDQRMSITEHCVAHTRVITAMAVSVHELFYSQLRGVATDNQINKVLQMHSRGVRINKLVGHGSVRHTENSRINFYSAQLNCCFVSLEKKKKGLPQISHIFFIILKYRFYLTVSAFGS